MSWLKQREIPFALFCVLVYVLSGVGVITHVDGVVNRVGALLHTGASHRPRVGRTGMTYARSRLWLGISGVGFRVALSVVALCWDWPSRLFPAPANTLREEGFRLGKLAAAYIALSAPFDVMGGYWLPRRVGRPTRSFVGFLVSWIRAVFLQSGILWLAWTTLLVAGRKGGRVGVLLAAAPGGRRLGANRAAHRCSSTWQPLARRRSGDVMEPARRVSRHRPDRR